MATPVLQSKDKNENASGSVTVTKPTGLAVGDLMLAIVYNGHSSGTPSVNTPANWTNAASSSSAVNGTATAVLWKIADSGDTAASNFTFTGTGTSATTASLYRISGHSASAPIAGAQITFNSTTFSLDPKVSDALLFLAGIQKTASGAGWSGYTVSGTNPTWTEQYDYASIAYHGVATATGNSASTITSVDVLEGGSNDEYRILVAIAATLNGSTTLDAVPITSAVPSLTLQLDMAITLDAVAITAGVPDHTFTTPIPTWTSLDKTPATNVTNQPKV